MEHACRLGRFFLLGLFTLIGIRGASAQDSQEISGKITDGSQPLADVAVSLEGTNQGTFTNEEGYYEIRAAEGQVLVYRLAGMKEVRIRVEDVTRYLNLRMSPEYTELDEVTVTAREKQDDLQIRYLRDKNIIRTAFGYVDANRNSGRVKILSDEDITPIGICILGILQNRFAGIQVTGNCIGGGEVRIRGGFSQNGLSSVVYDIDGMIFEETPIWLDINLIKRMAIFLSRSAATRYGSASAGGVIVINTASMNYGPAKGQILGATPIRDVEVVSANLVEQGAPSYLRELRAAESPDKAWQTYLEHATGYAASPFYFLDAYTHFYETGARSLADRVIDEGFGKFNNHPVLLKALGYLYQEQGRWQKALEVYQEIYKLRPDYSQSYLDLANAYRDAGQMSRAAALFGRYQYLLEEGMLAGSDDFWLLQQHDSDNLFQFEGEGLGADMRLVSSDEYVQNTTRLVFEWNDSEAEFILQFVNPEGRVFDWNHTYASNPSRIDDEKIAGYNSQEYIIDGSTPGKWQVNVTYEGNKSLTPTYMKVTTYFNYGMPGQRKEVRTFKLAVRGANIQLFGLENRGIAYGQ